MVRNSHVLELCHGLLGGGRPVVGTPNNESHEGELPVADRAGHTY